ncbi:type II secretion system protein GspK [Halanaerobacter jeridensis]|uniref:General secretion pathway protein K n=1 Tax=Halanaerobacter jeridensis TaxID=706427 RepID=A0A938XVC3_9FIRM|nr:type II secretion system protein GspK [Halanaerobacter jeridensis]MBM7557524.1 general secretion pathway protein K [Halanaerobacter jeridensis]
MKNTNGYALIVVLWSIVILSIIFVNLIDEAKLNSLLLRNNLQRRELKEAAVDGVMRGIDLLESDKTTADTRDEEWAKTLELPPQRQVRTKVQISDVGSKLNINYAAEDDLLQLQNLEWAEVKWNKLAAKLVWEDDLSAAEREKKLGLLSDFVELKAEFEAKADYQQAQQIFTTYGRFNPNLYQSAAWKKLLFFLKEKLDLSALNQRIIAASAQKLVSTEEGAAKEFATVEDFLKQAFPTDPLLREKIAPYLTVDKRININFVSQEVLELLLTRIERSKLSHDYKKTAAKIVAYCRTHEVKKLSKLNQIGVGMITKELKKYLTTQSSYFLIEVTAVNQQSKQEQKIAAVVHRIREDKNKFKVQIIKWQED